MSEQPADDQQPASDLCGNPGSIRDEFPAVAARYSDRRDAITEMVRIIANRLEVDACSVFGVDRATGALVLTATMGLNQSSVGHVRMLPGEGLVGLVAEELQPVFAENAPAHPRFLYFQDAGEELYISFFGVPILLRGILHGVLIVQTEEPRDLSSDWVRVATAAQRIAPFVAGTL